MGSFANSLHVRSNDADEVIAAIETALQETGCEPTDEAPAGNEAYLQDELRSLHISRAHQGWVGVLDSNLFNSAELAQDLSRRLETDVLQVLVHDSDYWCYLLYRDGAQVDEFNSIGDELGNYFGDGMEELPPEFAHMLADGDFQQQIQDLQAEFEKRMPAEMRAIQEKMLRGAATADEARQFGEWLQSQVEHMTNTVLPNVMPEFPAPSSSPSPSETPPVPDDDLQTHADALRPFLSAADDQGLLEVLQQRTVFAEQSLETFLPLLGISSCFAHLSYPYLEEFTEEELRAEQINLVAQLKYASPDDGPTFGDWS